jgi:hypothetical protein
MKRSLLLFIIVFLGVSLPLSAKKNQKYMCNMHTADFVQMPYKTSAFNGRTILSIVDNPTLYLDTCPNSITVNDKDSQVKKHVLWLSAFDSKNCYYGEDDSVSCMSTRVSE